MREDKKTRKRARGERKKRRHGRGFEIHMTAWLSTSFFLFVVNLMTGMGTPWFVYPTLGWFIGIAIHGAATGQLRTGMRKFFAGTFGWIGRLFGGRDWGYSFGDEPPSFKYGKAPLKSRVLSDAEWTEISNPNNVSSKLQSEKSTRLGDDSRPILG
jgi:hypothetical protein